MKSYWLGVISGLGFAALIFISTPYVAIAWHLHALHTSVKNAETLVPTICPKGKIDPAFIYKNLVGFDGDMLQPLRWDMQRATEALTDLGKPWQNTFIGYIDAADLNLRTLEGLLEECEIPPQEDTPAEPETP